MMTEEMWDEIYKKLCPSGRKPMKGIDRSAEDGPVVRKYKRINTPEEEAKALATIQRVMNEEHTKAYRKRAALAAG